jgi:hypothetical protein
MKICHIAPKGWQELLVPELEKLGHTVTTECDGDEDVVIVKSITQMKRAAKILKTYPHIPMIHYNWDVYSWALNNPRQDEYSYEEYRRQCEASLEVWTPSQAVSNSLKDYWDMDSHVIKSYVPTKSILSPRRKGYALQALRKNPDKYMDWYEKACKETGIDYEITWAKEMDEEPYFELLSNAGFLVSALYEMSTGGLFLMEGARMQKPILSARGRYLGAEEYFGDSIEYYDCDDFEMLKEKLIGMSNGTITTDTNKAMELVKDMTPDKMAVLIDERLNDLLRS